MSPWRLVSVRFPPLRTLAQGSWFHEVLWLERSASYKAAAASLSRSAVCPSAGKNVSIASSDNVTSTGVPNTVVVEMKLSLPTGDSMTIGTAIGTAGAAQIGPFDAGAG